MDPLYKLMRKYIYFLLFVHFFTPAQAQNNNSQNQRLKVFIDCSNTYCDRNFIQTEINIVDFYLDSKAADVHVLITEISTGGGGDQYQLIFFGQNQFRQITDTLRFNTDPNATEFEERDMLLKYLKLGLTPYIVKTGLGKDIQIEMKRKEGEKQDTRSDSSFTTKDPWNYWVFRTNVNGHISAEESIKQFGLNSEFSVNRVTEEIKTVFQINGGKNKSVYEAEDSNGVKQKEIIKNDNYNFEHYLILSINDHWSYGYEIGFSHSTFSNNKHRALFRTGIEFDIFPYKEVNTKFFTLAYIVDVRRNVYIDTTLYDKTKETLFGHGFESNLSFKQKWGTSEFGIEYHNYFHNWKFFSLGMHVELDIRITGGLSFNIFTFAELTRDQLFLPKETADLQEVLSRRRQLATGYNIFTHFGLNYRFGSKLNNFVNPRFD